jgi:hypothetical protein
MAEEDGRHRSTHVATIAGWAYIPLVSRSSKLVFIFAGLLVAPPVSHAACTWTPGVAYDAAGTLCRYAADGGDYALVQPHTSQVGWEPPNAPALWRRVSSRPTATAPPPATAATAAAAARIFAPYLDVNVGPAFSLAGHVSSVSRNYTLGFITSMGGVAAWVGRYPMSSPEAAAWAANIEELRAAGGDVIVSFGGASGVDLARASADAAHLQAQIQAVVDKYALRWVDFDIEDFTPAAIDTRNAAVKALQAANPRLKVSYTLGVQETGFERNQAAVLNGARLRGVRVDRVNLLEMDYGHPIADMYSAAVSSAQAARSWLDGNGFAATALGLTPMVGVNDSPGETFTLANASSLVAWARTSGVPMLGLWSVGRDNGNCAGAAVASPACSSLAQSPYQFAATFRTFAP